MVLTPEKYRKKPVVIEAVRWDGKLNTLYQLQTMGMETTIFETGTYPIEICNLRIKTLEGEHIANIGDWIIKGVKGEFYPCKPGIFEQTYEKAQLGRSQELCSECKGRKIEEYWDEGSLSHIMENCRTCHGTGKAQRGEPDSPELRKKIRNLLCVTSLKSSPVYECQAPHCEKRFGPFAYCPRIEKMTERLLALFPDTEAIKREELKRIRIWGSERCLDHHTSMNNISHRTCNECWQALKGE